MAKSLAAPRSRWPSYDAALVRRGDITLWLSEEAIHAWMASKKRGSTSPLEQQRATT